MSVQLVNNKLIKSLKLEVFKLDQRDNVELSEGLNKLSEEMDKVNDVLKRI